MGKKCYTYYIVTRYLFYTGTYFDLRRFEAGLSLLVNVMYEEFSF